MRYKGFKTYALIGIIGLFSCFTNVSYAAPSTPEEIEFPIEDGKDEYGHDMTYTNPNKTMPLGDIAKINKTNYKDKDLYSYMKSLDTNKNGYISNDEIKCHTGFIKIKGKKFFITKTTGLPKTSYNKISKQGYFFNNKGVMQTGLVHYNKKYMYFNSSGKQVYNKWIKNKYYSTKSGKLKTGWMTYKGKKYYFSSTAKKTIGMKTIHGKKYYFTSSGKLVTNKTFIYKNKKYHANKNGVII